MRGAEGCQDHYAQLRLLFRIPALKPSGEHARLQAALVRWFKRAGAQADVLGKFGCDRVQWERAGSDYQVIPLSCIVRRVYVVPDFTRPTEFFYISRFRADRTVPDNRTHTPHSEQGDQHGAMGEDEGSEDAPGSNSSMQGGREDQSSEGDSGEDQSREGDGGEDQSSEGDSGEDQSSEGDSREEQSSEGDNGEEQSSEGDSGED